MERRKKITYRTLLEVMVNKEILHYKRMKEMYHSSSNVLWKLIMFPILFVLVTFFHYLFELVHFLFETFQYIFDRKQFVINIKHLLVK